MRQVITAFIGNMLSKPEVVSWFLIYFMAVGFVVVLVFLRVRLLKILLKFAGPVCLGERSRKGGEDRGIGRRREGQEESQPVDGSFSYLAPPSTRVCRVCLCRG